MAELIDKQAALYIAMSYCPDDDGCCSKADHDLREMLDEIEALPIVHIDDMTFNIQNKIQAAKPSKTVKITFVRWGRWKKKNGEIYCTNCKKSKWSESFEMMLRRFNFCPNCGADMREGGADDAGRK